MLGFVLATTAIILGFAESERFTVLRESPHYPQLWRTLTSSVRILGLATVTTVVALVVDREPPDTNVAAMLGCGTATIWALMRTLRTVWALENIIRIATTHIATTPDT
jgi:hypothetical protein